MKNSQLIHAKDVIAFESSVGSASWNRFFIKSTVAFRGEIRSLIQEVARRTVIMIVSTAQTNGELRRWVL